MIFDFFVVIKTVVKKNPKISGLGLLISLSIIINSYHFQELPAAMWGDVIEHYKMTNDILNQRYFLNYRFGGDGALFSYLTALVSFFFGLSFESLKLTTILIHTATTICLYFLTLALIKKPRIAILAAFLNLVSFWPISFAHQGKPYILAAFFACLTVLLAVKQKRVLTGICLGLGLYTQIAFWGTPLLFLNQPLVLLIAFVISLPLIQNFPINSANLQTGSGYLGEKFAFSHQHSIFHIIKAYLFNFYQNFRALIIQGDSCFRHNAPYSAHLDIISFIFLLIGFIIIARQIIKQQKKQYFQYLLLPILLIQVPSVLDINNPASTPSMGRTIGITPFIFIIIAVGINALIQLIKKSLWQKISILFILLMISFLNLYKFYFIYPKTLPNHNLPFGRIIAEHINQSIDHNQLILLRGGWGDWGQPEPNSIFFRLNENIQYQVMDEIELKDFLITSYSNKIIIVSEPNFQYSDLINKNLISRTEILKKDQQEIAKIIYLKN